MAGIIEAKHSNPVPQADGESQNWGNLYKNWNKTFIRGLMVELKELSQALLYL